MYYRVTQNVYKNFRKNANLNCWIPPCIFTSFYDNPTFIADLVFLGSKDINERSFSDRNPLLKIGEPSFPAIFLHNTVQKLYCRNEAFTDCNFGQPAAAESKEFFLIKGTVHEFGYPTTKILPKHTHTRQKSAKILENFHKNQPKS